MWGRRDSVKVPFGERTVERIDTMAKDNIGKALTGVLREFQGAAPGVMGSAVVSADGFAIASELPGSVEERRVSAMAAAMLALGEQTAREFEHGGLERVFVEGNDGYTIVTSAGPDAVLAAIASKDAKLGLIFLQMARTAEAVKEAMAG
jgi:predicted regulator of Ras-like GTPase activity (Roadblock/LC7/MglB family)